MPEITPIRSRAQRRRDTEERLNQDVDLWVASASADGLPYLAPLPFDWDGETLLLATPAASPTGRNLSARGDRRRTGTRLAAAAEVLHPGNARACR